MFCRCYRKAALTVRKDAFSHMLRVRLTQDERDMLDALAGDQGLTCSDVVRQSIRAAYFKRFAEAERKTKRGGNR